MSRRRYPFCYLVILSVVSQHFSRTYTSQITMPSKLILLSRLNQGWRALMKKDISLLHDMNQPFVYDIRMYNRPYRLEFFDTASPEDYTLLQPNVVILCYDISNRKSLRSLRERWRNDVTRLYTDNNQNIPVVLLGLKRDLRTESGECIDPFEVSR